MRRTFSISTVLIVASSLLALTASSHAAERVTLRNGFAIQCSHHADIDGRVRLFPNAGEDSYIEFSPQDIASYDQAPDPPAQLDTAVAPSAQIVAAPARDARLSPADLHEMLSKAGREHNLDVDLLASLVKAESGGNTRAVSRAGARGLMQLMPKTAADLGVRDSFEPEQNLRGGSAYLDTLLTYYHNNLALALAAYNAGPAAVAKYHGIPPYRETRAYVAYVIHEFNRRVRVRQAHQIAASSHSTQQRSTQLSEIHLPK